VEGAFLGNMYCFAVRQQQQQNGDLRDGMYIKHENQLASLLQHREIRERRSTKKL